MSETPAEKFERLATNRAENAAKAIELIGNLSGKHYGWTQDQVQALFASLVRTLGASLARFKADSRWVATELPKAAPDPPEPVQEAAIGTMHDGTLIVQLQRQVRGHGSKAVVDALKWVIQHEQQYI